MADARQNGRSETRQTERRNGRRDGTGNGRLSGREAIEQVRRELPELLGRPVESVLGLDSEQDGGWRVTVQVVELARIPNSTDVLGSYTVTLDADGELCGYRRTRRYQRNQPDEDPTA